jgi:hypothetical protein
VQNRATGFSTQNFIGVKDGRHKKAATGAAWVVLVVLVVLVVV